MTNHEAIQTVHTRDLLDIFAEQNATPDEKLLCILHLQEMRTQKMLKQCGLTRHK